MSLSCNIQLRLKKTWEVDSYTFSGLLWTKPKWLWFLLVPQLTLYLLEARQSWVGAMFRPWLNHTAVQEEWQPTEEAMPWLVLLYTLVDITPANLTEIFSYVHYHLYNRITAPNLYIYFSLSIISPGLWWNIEWHNPIKWDIAMDNYCSWPKECSCNIFGLDSEYNYK